MNSEIQNYIDTLHRTHLDNAKTCYQATSGQRKVTSISPITNLVFELFLFNSLYSVDWAASIRDDRLTFFDTSREGPSETQKQRYYLKFCRQRCKEATGSIVSESFSALAGYLNSDSNSDWTLVTPDARITAKDGEKFFRDIQFLGSEAAECKLGTTKATFDRMESCTRFLYLIRNNIFHGQKKLGQIYDRDLLQRLSIYDLYVRCLNSLFFLSMGEQEYGSAYAQFPIRVENFESKAITFTASDVADLVYAKQFYFHRGDSNGEGGSNQQWDSGLFKKVLAMSGDRGLLVLTDGQPGGLGDEYASALHPINPPISHRNRAYHAGLIRE